MDERPGQQVGAKLLEWMNRKGETGLRLAEEIGMSPTTISNLINGQISRPQAGTVHRLARHFGVSPEDFLAGPEAYEAKIQEQWAAAIREWRFRQPWAKESFKHELDAWEIDRNPMHLDNASRILNEIKATANRLFLALGGTLGTFEQWSEYVAADRLKDELIEIVYLHEGLGIRRGSDLENAPQADDLKVIAS